MRVFRRQKGDSKQKINILEALGLTQEKPRLLFVCPHDDDAAIGAGLTMLLAAEAGCEIHVVIVTDGRMGYYDDSERDQIVEIRREETVKAYGSLGVKPEHIYRLEFPDAQLWNYIGRREANPGEPEINSFTGIENGLCWAIRKARPDAIFSASLADIHPDHKAVNMELLISIFHAISGIWPEMGSIYDASGLPLLRPKFFEWPTYMRPNGDPAVAILEADELMQSKCVAIGMWASQTEIIAEIVAALTKAGPHEFLWEPSLGIYSPASELHLFSLNAAASHRQAEPVG